MSAMSDAEENMVIKVICDTGRSDLTSLSSTHPTRHSLDLPSFGGEKPSTLMVFCHPPICDLHSQVVTASCCKATQPFENLVFSSGSRLSICAVWPTLGAGGFPVVVTPIK